MMEMCMAYTLLVTLPSPETVLVSQTQESIIREDGLRSLEAGSGRPAAAG